MELDKYSLIKGDKLRVYYICNKVSLLKIIYKDDRSDKIIWTDIANIDDNQKLLKVIDDTHIPQRRKLSKGLT